MQTVYPASIAHMVVHAQLFSHYGGRHLNACDWQAYLDCHGGHLARLLARLPCLKVLTAYSLQEAVVGQALVFQPCPQLVDIVTKYGNPQGLILDDFPEQTEAGAPSPMLGQSFLMFFLGPVTARVEELSGDGGHEIAGPARRWLIVPTCRRIRGSGQGDHAL